MYSEPHLRYVVEGCEQFKPGSEHHEALVAHGINPENNWRLVWSFHRLEDAQAQCREEQERWGNLTKFRVRDTQA